MAAPTFAELKTQLSNVVKILDENRRYGNVTATNNFISLLDTAEQSLENDYLDDISTALMAMRSTLASMVGAPIAAAVMVPFLRQIAKSILTRGNLSDSQNIIDELFRYMIDNGERIQSRVPVFSNPATSGTVIGNGQILRLTRDRYNQQMEAFFVEQKRARCIADRSTGTDLGREVFNFIGQVPSRDDLQRSGSGLDILIAGITTDDSLLSNASWSSFGGTIGTDAPTSLTDWTSSITINSTNYAIQNTAANSFRLAPSDGTTPFALRLNATTLLTQRLSVRGTKLDQNVPYLLAVAWNRTIGSASGTLVLRMGANVHTVVTVSAQSNWQITTVPNPIGQGCWYRQFAEEDVEIEIDWTRTAGTLIIDDVILAPGTFFDGAWYWILPASATTYTAFRVDDTLTWADSVTSTTGKIQNWFVRAFNRYLPSSNGSSLTWSDPS